MARRNGSSSSTMRSRGIRVSLSARFRHRQGDLRAASFGGGDVHLPSLALHHVPGEIESEPGAAARFLGGEERLSDAAQQGLRDADAVVAHLDAELALRAG